MRSRLVSVALLTTALAVGAPASAGGSQPPPQRSMVQQQRASSRPASMLQRAGDRIRSMSTRALGGRSPSSVAAQSSRPVSGMRTGATSPLASTAARRGGMQLAPHASPLMSKIAHAVDGTEHGGTIPASVMAVEGHVEHDVLLGGPKGFERMGNLIAGAKHEVLLQSYLWQKSEVGDTLLRSLPKLQDNVKTDPHWNGKPVEVRLLLNQRRVPGAQTLAKLVSKLPGKLAKEADRAASVRDTLGKDITSLKLDPRYVKVTIATHDAELLGSLHSKTVAIDGHTVVATGMNVQRSNDGVSADGADKAFAMDAAFVFHGADIGKAFRADFDHGWTASTGASLPKAPPPVADAEPVGAATKVPMMVDTAKANGNPLAKHLSDPHDQAFLAATEHATSEIRIMTPNLNEGAMRDSIVGAVKRGATVKIILGKGFNDVAERFAGGTNDRTVDRLYGALRDAGVHDAASRLQIRWYSADGKGPTPATLDERSHLKYASFDGKVAIVGSGNLDQQSFRHSQELNVVVDSAEVTKKWDSQVFEPAFSRSSPVVVKSRASESRERDVPVASADRR